MAKLYNGDHSIGDPAWLRKVQITYRPVSYTHLDVYKRQILKRVGDKQHPCLTPFVVSNGRVSLFPSLTLVIFCRCV